MQNHVKRSSKTKGTHDARRAIRSKARRTTYDAVCKFRQSAACPVLIEYYYTTRLPYIFHAFRAAQSSPEQARAAQSSTEQPRAAQSRPEQPRGSHMDAMKERLKRKQRQQVPEEPGVVETVRSELSRYLRLREAPGAEEGGEYITAWWKQRIKNYPLLMWGVRCLLQLSASNGALERAFGRSRQTLSAMRRQNRLAIVILNQNGVQFALPGYVASPSNTLCLDAASEDPSEAECAALEGATDSPGQALIGQEEGNALEALAAAELDQHDTGANLESNHGNSNPEFQSSPSKRLRRKTSM